MEDCKIWKGLCPDYVKKCKMRREKMTGSPSGEEKLA
jgi:hypothetical protein